MNALRLILKPIAHGWAVYLTDGREVARCRGPDSKRRALRYLAGGGGGDRGRPSSDVPSYWFIPSTSRPPQIATPPLAGYLPITEHGVVGDIHTND